VPGDYQSVSANFTVFCVELLLQDQVIGVPHSPIDGLYDPLIYLATRRYSDKLIPMFYTQFIRYLIVATLTFSVLVLFSGCNGADTGDWRAKTFSADLDRLSSFLEDGDSTSAITLTNDLLNRTEYVLEILHDDATSDPLQAVYYLEVRNWISMKLGNHLITGGSKELAEDYYAAAEESAKLAHEFRLNVDIADWEILRSFYTLGYYEFDNGNLESAAMHWQDGLDYAATFESDLIGEARSFYWERGSLYAGLASVRQHLDKFSTETLTLGQHSVENYFIGFGASNISADERLSLTDSISAVLASLTDNPQYLRAKIEEYICRAELLEDAALLGYLYTHLAFWCENYGHQALAGKWYDKSAELYSTDNEYGEAVFYALSYKTHSLLLQDKLAEAAKTKVRMDKLFLTLSDYGTTAVEIARNQARLLEADIAFSNGQNQQAAEIFNHVAGHQGYSADNHDSVAQRLNSLIMLIAFEPYSNENKHRLASLEEVLIVDEASAMTEADAYDLQIIRDAARLTINKSFWFEKFPESAIEVPDELTYAPLYNLYYWHESAFYRGDLTTERWVTEELLRRGLGNKYLGLLYGLYNI